MYICEYVYIYIYKHVYAYICPMLRRGMWRRGRWAARVAHGARRNLKGNSLRKQALERGQAERSLLLPLSRPTVVPSGWAVRMGEVPLYAGARERAGRALESGQAICAGAPFCKLIENTPSQPEGRPNAETGARKWAGGAASARHGQGRVSGASPHPRVDARQLQESIP